MGQCVLRGFSRSYKKEVLQHRQKLVQLGLQYLRSDHHEGKIYCNHCMLKPGVLWFVRRPPHRLLLWCIHEERRRRKMSTLINIELQWYSTRLKCEAKVGLSGDNLNLRIFCPVS